MSKKIFWKFKLISLAALPVLLVAAWFVFDLNQEQRATAIDMQLAPPAQEATPAVEVVTGKPTRIVVSAQNIDLPVTDGVYNQSTGEWTLSNDKAHFALISATANNQTGNTFIYGHNTSQVFQRLVNTKVGDKAEVITDNGYRFTYTYRRSIDVTPRDTEIFSYQGPAILTLQTCSGLWNQTRQLLTFDFVKVEKI